MSDSSNPAIISIAILMLVPVLSCYIVFKNFIYDLVKTSEVLSSIMTRLQFSKLLLFILMLLTVPWVILLVYHYIFDGAIGNYKSVLAIIYVCFFSIISTTFVLLELAPYLVDIFENTLGYLFLFIPYLNWNNKIIMFSKMFEQVAPVAVPTDTNNNNSYAFLITTISLLNMEKAIESLKALTIGIKLDPAIDANADNYKTIKELVLLKHSVGHFVWIYFATLICTFTSIKAFAKYLPT